MPEGISGKGMQSWSYRDIHRSKVRRFRVKSANPAPIKANRDQRIAGRGSRLPVSKTTASGNGRSGGSRGRDVEEPAAVLSAAGSIVLPVRGTLADATHPIYQLKNKFQADILSLLLFPFCIFAKRTGLWKTLSER